MFESTNRLKLRGFVNAGQLALNSQESGELAKLVCDMYESLPSDHPHYIADETGGGGQRGLPQHHPRIAELLDCVVANAAVRSVLESALGLSYKIWQIDFRRSKPGDKGLYLHQDAPGQVNLAIALSNNTNGSGATVFLPGSHLVPKRIRDWRIEVPTSLLILLPYLFTPLTGKIGDISFFFNRTWHGRFANTSTNLNDVIMIGFFPAGAYMDLAPPYVNWSAEFLQTIRGTELGRLIDPSIGTERQGDGSFKILSKENKTKTDLPYALAIETYQGRQYRLNNFKLSLSIILLRVIMGVGRPFARLFRKVIRCFGK